MIKKLIVLSILFLQIQCIYAENARPYIHCSPQLQGYIHQIQQLPEARRLIDNILAEGPLAILTNHEELSHQFGAFWDPDHRQICVNLNGYKQDREGHVLGSIIFELHNALRSKEALRLHELARMGQIDKRTYIEKMERHEYQNSLDAARLAQIGIDRGLFPSGARLPTYRSFEEHFRMQQIGGHSDWYAGLYDHLTLSS
jgi:hypothetical protein